MRARRKLVRVDVDRVDGAVVAHIRFEGVADDAVRPVLDALDSVSVAAEALGYRLRLRLKQNGKGAISALYKSPRSAT